MKLIPSSLLGWKHQITPAMLESKQHPLLLQSSALIPGKPHSALALGCISHCCEAIKDSANYYLKFVHEQ